MLNSVSEKQKEIKSKNCEKTVFDEQCNTTVKIKKIKHSDAISNEIDNKEKSTATIESAVKDNDKVTNKQERDIKEIKAKGRNNKEKSTATIESAVKDNDKVTNKQERDIKEIKAKGRSNKEKSTATIVSAAKANDKVTNKQERDIKEIKAKGRSNKRQSRDKKAVTIEQPKVKGISAKKSNEIQKCLNRLLEIKKELKSRKNLPIIQYNRSPPLHLKQIAFHKCEKRNRWVFGGNRSGKTECGAVEAIWFCRGIHPYRKNKDNVQGWAVSLSYEVQRDVAQSKIMKYLPKSWIADISMMSGRKGSAEYGIIDYILIKNVFGGVSKLSFKSCDQGREKFQGASLDFVWFDEEPPYDVYEECRMRVIDRVGDIWGTMTPLKGLTWVYDIIYLNSGEDNEIWCETMEWADNPYLSKKEITSLSKTMSKDTLESRRYGHFNSSEGLVYTEFDISKHVIEPFDFPSKWQDCISIDPGLHNPLACLFFAIDYDGNVYVVDEYYKSGKDIDYHSSKIFEKAKQLNWKYDSKGRIYGLIDSAANQKTLAGIKSVTELFYDKGIIVNSCVEKTLFAGIATVKDYLASGKLFIFKNCVNLIREIKSYWWGKGDNPIKKDDHALDALRYYLMSKPQPSPIEKFSESDITKDKRRLMRKRGRNER